MTHTDAPTDFHPDESGDLSATLAIASDLAKRLREAIERAHALSEDPFCEMLLADLIEPSKGICGRLYRMARFAEKREVVS